MTVPTSSAPLSPEHDAPICTQETARAAGLDVAPSPSELAAVAASIVRTWGDRHAEPDDETASTADAGAQLARAVPLLLAEVTRLRAELNHAHDDRTGACLARWEEEQDNARLRLALASAQRGRQEARTRIAELDRATRAFEALMAKHDKAKAERDRVLAALAGVLGIVSAWCIEANEVGGVDAGDLAWRLEQAGHQLPDEETPAPADPTRTVLDEVHAERQRQDARWGQQNHPDGTGLPIYQHSARRYRDHTERAAASGHLAWRDVLLEEVHEALAEADLGKLRAELVQVAAVAVCWAQAIDRRAAAPAEESDH
ncbi:hypothetical protein [Streptomyces sp. NPDC005970]|uniref:hypothetical protein n=1 Tax=Streptomyces sp. NPDC005970 TaxID=3156723 RepID=UPI003411C497